MTPTDAKAVQLLTVPEFAGRLRCSRGTAYNIIAAGLIATTKVGSVTRISEDALADYVRRHTTPARAK